MDAASSSPQAAQLGQPPQHSDQLEQPSRLTDLPPELLRQILEYLVPEHPELGDTRPVSYDKLVEGETWFDITRKRRALRALCLTSRGLYELVQPLLWRNIFILDEEGMVLLLRTFSERPDIGTYGRFLSTHLTLSRGEVIRELKRARTKYLPTFNPNTAVLRRDHPDIEASLRILVKVLHKMQVQSGEFDDVPQIMLYHLVCFLPKLNTVMLQVPVCDDHSEYTALFEKLRAHGSRNPPLHQVKNLLLQGDPELLMHFEQENCDCDIPELWGVQGRRHWSLFNSLPNIETVEISNDDGVWNNIRHRRPDGSRPPYLATIKHLFLHDSICSPRALHHILTNAPDLKTLYMTPRRDEEQWLDPEAEGIDEHPESFDAALRARPKQLTELDVAWWDCAGMESLIGPEGCLASLPLLVNLDKLCVQFAVLYGTDPTTLMRPLVDMLPPHITKLTLEEWWWEQLQDYDSVTHWTAGARTLNYNLKQDYRAQVLGVLAQFASDCSDKMPKLREVTFQTKFRWTWCLEGRATVDSHFEEVTRMFRRAGVAFNVDAEVEIASVSVP
ncbi:hypothetical protein GE09DRAFT_1229864 [Coniochaeta sp. 2T2.1]|nr:hypothetical protein GE09DRAFT_1229864 [Coniochaeta sp. 2T2.1]